METNIRAAALNAFKHLTRLGFLRAVVNDGNAPLEWNLGKCLAQARQINWKPTRFVERGNYQVNERWARAI